MWHVGIPGIFFGGPLHDTPLPGFRGLKRHGIVLLVVSE